MQDLTPSYVPETGEVILDGPRAGPAGEAGLVPVTGLDLAFDRADGHLVRVIVDTASAAAMELVIQLFGAYVAETLRDITEEADGAKPHPRLPVSGPCEALSNLARLNAARTTSPVPASSPWWSAEAAILAEQAGLHSRTLAEAGRAHCVVRGDRPRFRQSDMDVAAEVANLQKTCLPGLHWVLDPGIAPREVFRPGLTPYSDLRVRLDAGSDCVIVQAALARDADRPAAGHWHARLVDPSGPSQQCVLSAAEFKLASSHVQAELRFSPEEREETWIELVDDPKRPVRSAKAHRIQRALRWADVALRAERAPRGVAPWSTKADWAALAAVAWERCRRDWEVVGDRARAAAVLVPRIPLPGPEYIAEILGE